MFAARSLAVANKLITNSTRNMTWSPPHYDRVLPAGVPKGLPPKILNNIQPLTPLEIQKKEEKARFARKVFYKTKVQWKPHWKLEKCNNVKTLECYLWDTQQRLRWFRGEIADEARRSLRRSYLRVHINIHKLNEKYLIEKIHTLRGELQIPKLLEYNSPWNWDPVNPFVNELSVVARVQRSYPYPHKTILEPLARKQAVAEGRPLIDNEFAPEADITKVAQYMAKSRKRIFDKEKNMSVVVEGV